jgi:hypothetical protein
MTRQDGRDAGLKPGATLKTKTRSLAYARDDNVRSRGGGIPRYARNDNVREAGLKPGATLKTKAQARSFGGHGVDDFANDSFCAFGVLRKDEKPRNGRFVRRALRLRDIGVGRIGIGHIGIGTIRDVILPQR